MIAPKPAPAAVPTIAPFSLVLNGAEQPRALTRRIKTAEVTKIFFMPPPYFTIAKYPRINFSSFEPRVQSKNKLRTRWEVLLSKIDCGIYQDFSELFVGHSSIVKNKLHFWLF
jgi:hypothetical protein